jgi:phage gp46-like protein
MRDISADIFKKAAVPALELFQYTEDNFLKNSIWMSLCTNLRIDLPSLEKENSGWWADALYPGDEIGSYLFTLRRAKKKDETLDSAFYYTQEALEWIKKKPGLEVEIGVSFSNQDIKITIDLKGQRHKTPHRFETFV